MTSIKAFLDEHDLDAEDVIDALDLEVPNGPSSFYDGQPDAQTLADDFDAVDLLIEENDSLEQRVDSLEADLREHEREAFADKASDLAEMTTKWGDAESLVAKFDDEDNDEFTSVDDLTERIEIVEDIRSDVETTTTTQTDDESTDTSSLDAPTTDTGKYILSDTINAE